MVERVIATEVTLALVERLARRHGPLVFHQSGGCCDGSAPMCLPATDFRAGGSDVRLGAVGEAPFWMARDQFAFFRHTQLIIDVAPGRGASFSVEIPEGVRFITRGRVFTDAEAAELDAREASGA